MALLSGYFTHSYILHSDPLADIQGRPPQGGGGGGGDFQPFGVPVIPGRHDSNGRPSPGPPPGQHRPPHRNSINPDLEGYQNQQPPQQGPHHPLQPPTIVTTDNQRPTGKPHPFHIQPENPNSLESEIEPLPEAESPGKQGVGGGRQEGGPTASVDTSRRGRQHPVKKKTPNQRGSSPHSSTGAAMSLNPHSSFFLFASSLLLIFLPFVS